MEDRYINLIMTRDLRPPTCTYTMKGVPKFKGSVYSVVQKSDGFWIIFHKMNENRDIILKKVGCYATEQAAEKQAWKLTKDLHEVEETEVVE